MHCRNSRSQAPQIGHSTWFFGALTSHSHSGQHTPTPACTLRGFWSRWSMRNFCCLWPVSLGHPAASQSQLPGSVLCLITRAHSPPPSLLPSFPYCKGASLTFLLHREASAPVGYPTLGGDSEIQNHRQRPRSRRFSALWDLTNRVVMSVWLNSGPLGVKGEPDVTRELGRVIT